MSAKLNNGDLPDLDFLNKNPADQDLSSPILDLMDHYLELFVHYTKP